MTRDEELPPEHERRVSRFWRDGRSRGGRSGQAAMGAAFGVLDELFSPGAAKAKEQLKGDHERVIPVPSPGDDALKRGRIVIRKPRTDVPPADDGSSASR